MIILVGGCNTEGFKFMTAAIISPISLDKEMISCHLCLPDV